MSLKNTNQVPWQSMDIKSCRSYSVKDRFQTRIGDDLAEVIQINTLQGNSISVNGYGTTQ